MARSRHPSAARAPILIALGANCRAQLRQSSRDAGSGLAELNAAASGWCAVALVRNAPVRPRVSLVRERVCGGRDQLDPWRCSLPCTRWSRVRPGPRARNAARVAISTSSPMAGGAPGRRPTCPSAAASGLSCGCPAEVAPVATAGAGQTRVGDFIARCPGRKSARWLRTGR